MVTAARDYQSFRSIIFPLFIFDVCFFSNLYTFFGVTAIVFWLLQYLELDTILMTDETTQSDLSGHVYLTERTKPLAYTILSLGRKTDPYGPSSFMRTTGPYLVNGRFSYNIYPHHHVLQVKNGKLINNSQIYKTVLLVPSATNPSKPQYQVLLTQKTCFIRFRDK